MLPLWPKKLFISLSAGHVAFVCRTWLTHKIVFQSEKSVHANSSQVWQDALMVLESMLLECQFSANTSVSISLASDFVRYLALPASAQDIAYTDKHAYAQAAFREVFGEDSLTWAIAFDDVAPNQPTLCAAIDQALLDALHILVLQRGLKLTAIQPYAINAINVLNRSLRHANGVLVIIENSRLILANFKSGVCTQMRAQVLSQDWQVELSEQLSRISLLEEDVVSQAFLYAPAFKAHTIQPLKDWQLQRIGISRKSATQQHPYTMLEVML